jgi:hypothetical protein
MRIISKFVDYYDSVQKYGQDMATTFIRKEEFIEPLFTSKKNSEKWRLSLDAPWECFPAFPKVEIFKLSLDGFNFSAYPFMILIGNKHFFGISLSFRESGYSYNEHKECCFSAEAVSDFIQKHKIADERINNFYKDSKGWRWRSEYDFNMKNLSYSKNFD